MAKVLPSHLAGTLNEPIEPRTFVGDATNESDRTSRLPDSILLPQMPAPDVSRTDRLAMTVSAESFSNCGPILGQLLDTTQDAVLLLDSEGHVRELNRSAAALLGVPEGEPILGKLWWENFQDPAARIAHSAFMQAQDGRRTECELHAVGSPSRWWSVTISPIISDSGQITQILALMRDITRQRHSEDGLRASEQLFHGAFEHSVMGLVVSRLNGEIVRANPAFCRMVGYPSEQFVGRTSAWFTHPDDRQATLQAIHTVAGSDSPIRGYEKRYIHRDGHIVWTRITLSLVSSDDGQEATMIGTVEDVTEQKRLELARMDSEQRLRLVFESVTDYAIFTFDPNGIVTSWNAGAERIFGYTASEIVGQDSIRIWLTDDREQGLPERERRTAAELGRADDERWHCRKDGSRFFASGAVRPMVDQSGSLVGFSKVCRDVTSQRQAERDLAEARQRIAQTLETERSRLAEVFERSTSFMAVVSGPQHVFELVNDQYRRLTGDRQLLGLPVCEALPEVVSQGFVALLDGVYNSGQEFVGQDVRVMLMREGNPGMNERFLDFIYRPTRDGEGRVNGIFIHGNDITERKVAERQLARVAEQLHLALDSARMGWWQVDLLTGQVYWDQRSRDIFGITEVSLPYSELIESIHPDDRVHVEDSVSAATDPRDPQQYSIEYRVIPSPGIVRWVRANGQTYYEGEGDQRRAVSFVGTLADITDERIAADSLRESESKFRQLADAMPQIVFLAQPDGHVDYFNRRWYEYTGINAGEVGYESWKHVHEEAGLKRVMEVWPEALRTGSPYEIEYRLRRADGEFRWHLGRALPVRDDAGSVVRWYGTNTDIHEQKELQVQNEQLLESERAARGEAERASRMKDEFLATLSHELRTPLNAILGWATLLRGQPDPEDVAQGIEVIERNARAQTQIIADLLDMSRIISGKVRLDVQRTELAPIIHAAIDTVRPTAEVKGIRLQAVLDPLNRPIHGDPNRLQQVFWNLLTNAVKFTPREGRIQVLLEKVHSHLEISVSDSGEGIKPEFLPYVFDRFRQADASTTRKHGGLGLGLAIVKQLVELHGGSVRVTSQGQGQGTTFTVSLPLLPLHAELPSAPNLSPRSAMGSPIELTSHLDLSGLKILVVDDEPDARALVARLLEGCDAKVWQAGSVAEAIELLRAQRPDVLLSDIGMPGEDGYSMIRRVRALSPQDGGATPAVALTAYARTEDRMKAILAGFQMHLTKPVEAAELLTVIASLSGRTSGR